MGEDGKMNVEEKAGLRQILYLLVGNQNLQ